MLVTLIIVSTPQLKVKKTLEEERGATTTTITAKIQIEIKTRAQVQVGTETKPHTRAVTKIIVVTGRAAKAMIKIQIKIGIGAKVQRRAKAETEFKMETRAREESRPDVVRGIGTKRARNRTQKSQGTHITLVIKTRTNMINCIRVWVKKKSCPRSQSTAPGINAVDTQGPKSARIDPSLAIADLILDHKIAFM